MPNANEYYALMQALQQKQPNPWNQRAQTGVDAITKITQAVLANKVKKDIESKISEAEKSGKRVEYKIDPQTGLISPVILSQSYEGVFEALKNPDVASKYELGRGAKGEPRLMKKKQFPEAKIEGFRQTIKNLKEKETLIPFKNPATGETQDIDLGTEEGMASIFKIMGGEGNWREHPEVIESGVADLWDKKMAEIKAPKAQPKKEGFMQKLTQGRFKAGETRTIGGVVYTRNDKGQWVSGE